VSAERRLAEAERAAAEALAAIELPAPSAEERAALRASIEAKGVLLPAVVSAGPALPGEVADGRARLEICAELGRDCPRQERPFPSEAEFGLFRLEANLRRRQLSDAERIEIGMALEPIERAQAAARRAQAKGGRQGEKSLPVALPEEKGETRQRVARAVGLRPSTYARGAKVLAEGSARLVADFETGRETVNGAYRRLRSEQRRGERLALAERIAQEPPPLPGGRFPVVVLDPPWPMPSVPYPTESLDEIASLALPELLTEDAIVWLWTTNRFLFAAQEIATKQWELDYRNMLTWGKDRMGTGNWLRGQTEHCLLFSRGKPVFLADWDSTLLLAKTREHSRKPEEFYELVERTCPGAKLELFSRQRRAGWVTSGAELDLFPTLASDDAAEAP
jgi:N6-adenosine-specific RNA methylase IME4